MQANSTAPIHKVTMTEARYPPKQVRGYNQKGSGIKMRQKKTNHAKFHRNQALAGFSSMDCWESMSGIVMKVGANATLMEKRPCLTSDSAKEATISHQCQDLVEEGTKREELEVE
jgi:hypothetical protein